MSRAARLAAFAAAALPLLATVTAAPVRAQQDAPPPTPVDTGKPRTPRLYSMDLKDTPLPDSLKMLFATAGAQYSVSGELPAARVTLRVTDQPFENVLRFILREGNQNGTRLTYTRENNVYFIKKVAEPTEPAQTETFTLTYLRPQDVLPKIEGFIPGVQVIAQDYPPGLILRGEPGRIQQVREVVRLMDIAPRTVILKAEVVMVVPDSPTPGTKKTADGAKATAERSRSVLLATILRGTTGREAEGEDKITGPPAQSVRLGLRATPIYLGDGSYELTARWDVSLPLSTGKGGVRIEKRLTSTARLKPNETETFGGIILSQYGLKGQILFFVTLSEVITRDTAASPAVRP